MKLKKYNLNVGWSDEFLENTELFSMLGWDGICFTERFHSKFNKTADKIMELKEKADFEIFLGAIVSKPLRKNARKALEKADLILAQGDTREASECWEIDVICCPEKEADRDFMRQRNSGIDSIIARYMSEKFIALELNLDSLLHSKGRDRATLIGRMRQNIMLSRKYQTPLIFTSGSVNLHNLRGPLELISLGKILGLREEEAWNTVSLNPSKLIQKSRDRRNPDVLLKGLEVLDWGGLEKPVKKKMYGWY